MEPGANSLVEWDKLTMRLLMVFGLMIRAHKRDLQLQKNLYH